MVKKLIFVIIAILIANIHSSFAQCPRGIKDCKGICGRFIDENNDGYCDLSEITKHINKLLSDSCKKIILKNKIENATAKKIKPITDSVKIRQLAIDSIINNWVQQLNASSKTLNKAYIKPKQRVYDLIFVSSITISLYLLTFILSLRKIIKKVNHRKIWNVMLLLCFLISCLFGFFLVIQINYKILPDIYETILYWHVEVGISMTLIAVFHTWWHLPYYKNIFKIGSSNRQ